MRAKTLLVLAALLASACSSGSEGGGPPAVDAQPGAGGSGAGGRAGGSGAGGGGGAAGAGAGGSGAGGQAAGAGGGTGATSGGGGSGGHGTGGGGAGGGSSGGTAGGDAGVTADAAADAPPAGGEAGPSGAGGEALMVVGGVPGIGTDTQIKAQLEARGLKVTEVVEAMVDPAQAEGKALVVLSYSLDTKLLKASFADVRAPIIVMEQNLLPALGMTGAAGHGYQLGVTQVTIVSSDPVLTAGVPMGDVTVFSKTGEVFWGVPGPGAIKVATVKGNAGRVVTFAYPAGAMMASRPAPAKRLQFFFGAHLVPDIYLNDTGVKLLGAAIDWSLR
jgi:hypothetical protein